MAELPVIPGLDTQRAALLIGDDRTFFLAVLEAFAAEYADTARQVRQDLNLGQAAKATRQLHTLRGTAGQIGADALMQSAAELEAAIKARTEDLTPLLDAFAAQLDAVIDAIAPWIQQPRPGEPELGQPADAAPDPERLEALRIALSQHELVALDLFEALQPALARTLGESTVADLAEDIRRLRFAAALAVLDQAAGAI